MNAVSVVALLLGSVASFVAIMTVARSALKVWKVKAVEEADNTKAIKENTVAVKLLTSKLENHETRIRGLEHGHRT